MSQIAKLYLFIKCKNNVFTVTVKAGNVELKVTDEFCYLGNVLSSNTIVDDDINSRLSKANVAFGRLSKRYNMSQLPRTCGVIMAYPLLPKWLFTGLQYCPPFCMVVKDGPWVRSTTHSGVGGQTGSAQIWSTMHHQLWVPDLPPNVSLKDWAPCPQQVTLVTVVSTLRQLSPWCRLTSNVTDLRFCVYDFQSVSHAWIRKFDNLTWLRHSI